MITSLSNERIKHIYALQTQRRIRHKSRQFVIEGSRLVRESIEAGAAISEVFYTEDFAVGEDGQVLLDSLSHQSIPLMVVDEPVMQHISDTSTPQGILAVLPLPSLSPPEEIHFALVIDSISDPGNMGTIMRTALGAATPVLIITAGTVDITNPKVVRSAMGAHFYLPVLQLSWEGIAGRFTEHAIFLSSSRGGAPYYSVDWTQDCLLIVSDEAHGPTDHAVRTAHAHVKVPIERIESLNVAAAAAVMLFERVRQHAEAAPLESS